MPERISVVDRSRFRQMVDVTTVDDRPFEEGLVGKFTRLSRKREYGDVSPTGEFQSAKIGE